MTINFDRANTLLDVVQKVASIAPTYTALSSVAMMELKAMNDEAQKQLDDLGQKRLEAEQQAQAAAEEARLASEPKPEPHIPETVTDTPVTRRV